MFMPPIIIISTAGPIGGIIHAHIPIIFSSLGPSSEVIAGKQYTTESSSPKQGPGLWDGMGQ